MSELDKRQRNQQLCDWLNFLSFVLIVGGALMFFLGDVLPEPTFDYEDRRAFMHFSFIVAMIGFFAQLSIPYVALPGINTNRFPPSIAELMLPDYEYQKDGTFLVRNKRGFNQALNHYRCTANSRHGLKWTEGVYTGRTPETYEKPLIVKFKHYIPFEHDLGPAITAEF